MEEAIDLFKVDFEVLLLFYIIINKIVICEIDEIVESEWER
jgi:hypothetical protein